MGPCYHVIVIIIQAVQHWFNDTPLMTKNFATIIDSIKINNMEQ